MTTRKSAKEEVKPEAPKTETPELTQEDLQKKISDMKTTRKSSMSKQKLQGILEQLPKGKTASELKQDPMEYALKVVAAQSVDAQPLTIVAKVQRALKRQGFSLEEVDKVVTSLENAYK